LGLRNVFLGKEVQEKRVGPANAFDHKAFM